MDARLLELLRDMDPNFNICFHFLSFGVDEPSLIETDGDCRATGLPALAGVEGVTAVFTLGDWSLSLGVEGSGGEAIWPWKVWDDSDGCGGAGC